MIIIEDKRYDEKYTGIVMASYRTFGTYDAPNIPHNTQHWWNVFELDNGFSIIISDKELTKLSIAEGGEKT